MLSKGQEWDWFGDPFWRVHTLLAMFVRQSVRARRARTADSNPLINFRTLSDRNFRCVLHHHFLRVWRAVREHDDAARLAANAVWLRRDDFRTRAVAGRSVRRGDAVHRRRFADARRRRTLLDRGRAHDDGRRQLLDVAAESRGQPVADRLAARRDHRRPVDGLRAAECRCVSCTFRRNCAAAAVGLLALLRNEGGSVGTSVAKIILDRREQFHTLRLGEYLDALNPTVSSFLEQAQSYLLQLSGDPVAARQLALQLLDNLRQQQSSALAYFDIFLVLAALSVPLVALVFMMKRSVAQKGAHVAAE